MGCSNPSAICAPGWAPRICHISVLPRPHSPSGCTCTDSLSEVNRSFTRIGRGGSAVYQYSPIFWPLGIQTPQTRSRELLFSLTGCGVTIILGGDEFVEPLETALQLVHRRGVGNANMPVDARAGA